MVRHPPRGGTTRPLYMRMPKSELAHEFPLVYPLVCPLLSPLSQASAGAQALALDCVRTWAHVWHDQGGALARRVSSRHADRLSGVLVTRSHRCFSLCHGRRYGAMPAAQRYHLSARRSQRLSHLTSRALALGCRYGR